MREYQIGTALYCALGTGCRSGAGFRRCLRVATIPSSHEDHPRPPIHSGGSLPLYMPCMSLACVTWSCGIQLEPSGRRSERSQRQNGHDDVP
jgi:hypothetical protein